jgi:hypothetical protein
MKKENLLVLLLLIIVTLSLGAFLHFVIMAGPQFNAGLIKHLRGI